MHLDYFKKPEKNKLNTFFKFHPKQPYDGVTFNPLKLYFRKENNTTFVRQWLSHSNNTFFCTFCLAFGNEENRFTIGCKTESNNNPSARIKEHERSLSHQNSSEAFLMYSNVSDIESRLNSGKRYEVERKRAVLGRLTDIVKVIGKRGLSYRGAKNAEAAYTLDNCNLDHGNFLEILILLSKYDPLLNEHVKLAVFKSQLAKTRQKDNVHSGRPGGLVTYLSKTTVDYIIEAIGILMKKSISESIREANFFSVQIDSTQDVNVHDQVAVIIRFVNEKVNERLVALVDCKSGTGKNLCDIVCNVFNELNLDIKNCIGSSTDGASNMRGQYNGFSAWLNKQSPDQTHVWCYAHVLNLVMIDTTQVCCQSTTLFGLINSIAVFFRESYLRMNVWTNNSKAKCISLVGDTRWWAKDRCLNKVFGSYSHPQESLFVYIVHTLHEIYTSTKFNQDARFKAKAFIDALLKYETILTAHIFLKIFITTSPVSLYLQSKEMNVIQAYTMVIHSISVLSEESRNFDEVVDNTNLFIDWANDEFIKNNLDYTVENCLPEKRCKKKKINAW